MNNSLSIFYGRARILDAEGRTIWQEETWQHNTIMHEGQEHNLNVWLREQANSDKFLALLSAAPADKTKTMADMSEILPLGTNGYNRKKLFPGDWAAPALDSGDMWCVAEEKLFDMATGAPWTGITHVAIVTSETDNSGKFLAFLPLTSPPATVAIGKVFGYVVRVKLKPAA